MASNVMIADRYSSGVVDLGVAMETVAAAAAAAGEGAGMGDGKGKGKGLDTGSGTVVDAIGSCLWFDKEVDVLLLVDAGAYFGLWVSH